MIWLRKALGLCVHKWEVRDRITLTFNKKPIGDRFILQCEHCGKLKKQDLE